MRSILTMPVAGKSTKALPRAMFQRPDRFFNIARTQLHTSRGAIELPIFILEMKTRQLNYLVLHEMACALVTGTGLVPCRIFEDKALVSLTLNHCLDSSLGAYDEIGLTLLVRPATVPNPKLDLSNSFGRDGSRKDMGGYLLYASISSGHAAQWAREVWGYEKFEASVHATLDSGAFSFGVRDPDAGGSVLDVRGKISFGLPLPGFEIVTYSVCRGDLLRTSMAVDANYKLYRSNHIELQVGASNHPMAAQIRHLGMAQKSPFAVLISDRFRAWLPVGQALD